MAVFAVGELRPQKEDGDVRIEMAVGIAAAI